MSYIQWIMKYYNVMLSLVDFLLGVISESNSLSLSRLVLILKEPLNLESVFDRLLNRNR